MTKLIKNWEELSKVPPNDKYRIVVDLNMGCGHIIPVTDEPTGNWYDFKCFCDNDMSTKEYFEQHVYLSTHTFYGLNYKQSTKILHACGFDVEIDNWDKDQMYLYGKKK